MQPPQQQSTQHSQSFDVPDRYSKQIWLRREWEEKIEWLNEKYNLDYYSSSESESKSEPENRYEHKYKTLIWTELMKMQEDSFKFAMNICAKLS